MKTVNGIIFLESYEQCEHIGCNSHITHPCEGCGRIGAQGMVPIKLIGNKFYSENFDSYSYNRGKFIKPENWE